MAEFKYSWGRGMKICKKCKQEKPLEEYYFSQGRYQTKCKQCFREYQRNRTREMKKYLSEDWKQYRREYYALNKDKFVVYRKRWLDKHPEYMKDYREKKKI